MRKKQNRERGFTLLEMLVSMTLFSFVITIALGSLFSILKANEKTKVIKLVVNNLNMALEGMSREIRVGYDFVCSGNECQDFSFKTKDGCTAEYTFSGNTIYKEIEKKLPSDTGVNCSGGDQSGPVAIVGSDISITDLTFRTTGLASGDNEQPRVLITLKGEVENNSLDNNEIFNIQTTIAQRKIQP